MLRSLPWVASVCSLGFAACSSSSQPDPGAAPGAGDAATDDATAPGEEAGDAADDPESSNCTPPDPTPDQGPGGYPLDGWSWKRKGIVLEKGTAAAQDGYLAPAAVVASGVIHLWVTRKAGTEHRILHTRSSDGLSFETPVETTGLEGQDIIAYPSVVYDGTEYRMWYGSGTIDHARSKDGTTWTMVGTSVLKPGEAGAFDSLSLLYPSVVAGGPGYVMFYTGFDGAAFSIGRAESSDGVAWVKSPAGPVLEKAGPFTFDNHAVAQPCAVAWGNATLLWYGGYDTSVANPGPYRIGLGIWKGGGVQRVGVTLDLEAAGPEAWSTRDPAVVRWGDGWWMAYCAMGDDGRYRVAVAESATCGP